MMDFYEHHRFDAALDAADSKTGRTHPAHEPTLLYVTAVRLFRWSVGLGLLAGAVACGIRFLASLTSL